MIQLYNVMDKRVAKKLEASKRFVKYPEMFLSSTCKVIVNKDDFLKEDEFILQSNLKILPRRIYLFGKKTTNNIQEDNIYLNYWMPVFLKTIEQGNLVKHDFEKSNSKLELTIGLPIKYRMNAFAYRNWERKDVKEFLCCLFNNELIEQDYEQQDFFDNFQNVA